MITSWQLKDFEPDDAGQVQALAEVLDESFTLNQNGWIAIDAPGDVHTALIAAGRLPDPFYDQNETACTWVEQRAWWYRASFTDPVGLASDERMLLIFEGVDTYATFWLNGHALGQSANMFREVVFDISQQLRPGHENVLAICIHPPLQRVAGKPAPFLTAAPVGSEMAKALMRKAQFGYGWDWGPRLPTIGLWRPALLRRQRRAAIASVHCVTESIASGSAALRVDVEVDAFAPPAPTVASAPLQAHIALKDAQQHVVAQTTLAWPDQSHTHIASAALTLANPHLWWTHDLGQPYLYTLEVSLCAANGETNGGATDELDRHTQSIGVRTITLDQSPDPDEPGTRFFRFVLNGVPIFARGACWIPADSFVGALTAERYAAWISAARAANMNMLRVWGGGLYEPDVFYELCNRQGILIWQDFMFACAAYPEDDPTFVDEVRQEAVYQVRRLRNHPCLAVWVGNNECQVIDYLMKHLTHDSRPLPGNLFYDTLLPEIVAAQDGHTPYWPGSPYGGKYPNDPCIGDVHDWTVWHGLSEDVNFSELFTKGPTPEQVAYTRYAEDQGRFISEFGMHAAPVIETLRRVIPADQLYHHSPSMDHHNKDNPKNKGDLLMMTSTGLPKDLAEYIDFSMMAQAEGLKFGIEHFRRRKPHCSGTLLWQLNDCWPVLSWAIMDYYGFGKAGYFYTRRAYAPVLASFKALDDGAIELWITNDTLQPVADTVRLNYGHFESGSVWEECIPVQVPANASQAVWRGEAARVIAQPDAYLAVHSTGGSFPTNRHFFTAIKDLQRAPAVPQVSVVAQGPHELRVCVEAQAYVYFFHLMSPDARTAYSDNYFDLGPSERVEITVTNPAIELTPGALTFGWR